MRGLCPSSLFRSSLKRRSGGISRHVQDEITRADGLRGEGERSNRRIALRRVIEQQAIKWRGDSDV